jgi:hypothetical protein
MCILSSHAAKNNEDKHTVRFFHMHACFFSWIICLPGTCDPRHRGMNSLDHMALNTMGMDGDVNFETNILHKLQWQWHHDTAFSYHFLINSWIDHKDQHYSITRHNRSRASNFGSTGSKLTFFFSTMEMRGLWKRVPGGITHLYRDILVQWIVSIHVLESQPRSNINVHIMSINQYLLHETLTIWSAGWSVHLFFHNSLAYRFFLYTFVSCLDL